MMFIAVLLFAAPVPQAMLETSAKPMVVAQPSAPEIDKWHAEQYEIKRLYSVGSFAEAEIRAKRNLAKAISLFGPNSEWVGTAYTNLAACEYQLGRFAESDANYDRAVAIYEADPAISRHRLAITLNNQVNSLQEVGQVEKAERLARKSIEILLKINDRQYDHVLAAAYSNLSNSQIQQGRFEEAIGSQHSSLFVNTRIYGKDSSQLGYDYADLGTIYQFLGDFENASSNLVKGISSILKTPQPDLTRLSSYYGALAISHLEAGDAKAAKAEAQKAHDIIVRLHGENSPWLGSVLLTQALIEMDLGNEAVAEEKVRRGLTLADGRKSQPHELSGGLLLLAMLQIKRDELDQAQLTLERAAGIAESGGRLTRPMLIDALFGLRHIFDLQKREAERDQIDRRLVALGIPADALGNLPGEIFAK